MVKPSTISEGAKYNTKKYNIMNTTVKNALLEMIIDVDNELSTPAETVAHFANSFNEYVNNFKHLHPMRTRAEIIVTRSALLLEFVRSGSFCFPCYYNEAVAYLQAVGLTAEQIDSIDDIFKICYTSIRVRLSQLCSDDFGVELINIAE